MIANLTVKSDQLNAEDLRALLQAIRDCEMANFPDKEIHVFIEVPQLNMAEITEILTSIKPPYKYGPIDFSNTGRIRLGTNEAGSARGNRGSGNTAPRKG